MKNKFTQKAAALLCSKKHSIAPALRTDCCP